MDAHVLILSGAGISADSGLQTFRDADGLWEGHRPEDVATPAAWARDRALVWRFYQERRARLGEVEPNPGHHALALLERELRERGADFTLVTQNVDDLHERAGSSPLHMHGELARLACERCGAGCVDLVNLDPARLVPCAQCGHDALRPAVVWFGEVPEHLEAIGAALARCTVFAAIGTSGAVWPAAGLLAEARLRGAATWVQSLDAPDNLDPRDRFVPGRAAEVLPGMVRDLLETL